MAGSAYTELTWQVQLSQFVPPNLFPRDSRFRPLKAASKGRAIPGSKGWWLKSTEEEAMTLTLTQRADHALSTLCVVATHVYVSPHKVDLFPFGLPVSDVVWRCEFNW